jgi:hypothetical protein
VTASAVGAERNGVAILQAQSFRSP